jgi:hypothetical protein
MLPKSVETPRLKELNALVGATPIDEIAKWPLPKEEDFALVGAIAVQYGYIDLNLRRFAEAAHAADFLEQRGKRPIPDKRITEIEKLVLAFPDWSPREKFVLEQIQEKRGVRNLIAHFAMRRFPKDDAYLFLTKSAFDYRQVFDDEPKHDELFVAVMECEALRKARTQIEELQTWLADITPAIIRMFANASKALITTSTTPPSVPTD